MTNKTYIQLNFSPVSAAQSEILVALLANSGFTGFEEEAQGLKAFIGQEDLNSTELESILAVLPLEYTTTEIAGENWNAKWESSFEPIVVNDFVAIRANFHQPIPAVKHQVIITPKMSFGTGHHATTCLVIEEMEKLDLAGKTVLDFGTGTGILAILAEKMGAAFIKAIDNDDWSIDNAIENIAANHCERIVIEKAETIPGDNVFDIILANINLNVIMANLTTISHVCKKDSTIILSGFLHTDETELLSELSKQGFAHLSTSQKGEWIALVVKWEGR